MKAPLRLTALSAAAGLCLRGPVLLWEEKGSRERVSVSLPG